MDLRPPPQELTPAAARGTTAEPGAVAPTPVVTETHLSFGDPLRR